MRHSEFWARMEDALGPGYYRSWSAQQVMSSLDDRTVDEAIADGEPPKVVWRAVWERLELPAAKQ